MLTAAAWLVLAATVGYGQAKQCSPAEAKAAEVSADRLNNWADVERAFRAYEHCDDGAIAEGFSDRIMHLLARRWSTVPDLSKRGVADPAFQAFVLRHIDETWTRSELELVQRNAATSCPSSARSLCAAITKRGQELAGRTKAR